MANGATGLGLGTRSIDLLSSSPILNPLQNNSGNTTQQSGSVLQTSDYPLNTSKSYSGSDVIAYITPYASNTTDSPYIQINNLHTISYSTHRDKLPVRRLGSAIAHDYTHGTRTVAGSIVMINFDRVALAELIMGKDLYGDDVVINMFDEIPPFDITLLFNNDATNKAHNDMTKHIEYSVIEIKGIRLLDEGLVTGIDEAYLETSLQYVAEGIQYLKPLSFAKTGGTVSTVSTNLLDPESFPESIDEFVTNPPVKLEAFDVPTMDPNGELKDIREFCEDAHTSDQDILDCLVDNYYNLGGIGSSIAFTDITPSVLFYGSSQVVSTKETTEHYEVFNPLVVFPVSHGEASMLASLSGPNGNTWTTSQALSLFKEYNANSNYYYSEDEAKIRSRIKFGDHCEEAFSITGHIFTGCQEE